MSRKVVFAALLAGAFALTTSAVDAHPRLRMALPAAGALLKVAPREIRMKFSEGLIVQFTRIELKDGRGRRVPTGKAMLNPGDNSRFVVPIKARLGAGTYNVAWSAVSVDTHRVSGRYTFKVVR